MQPPWHDAMLELRGPAVTEVLRVFVERWDDPRNALREQEGLH